MSLLEQARFMGVILILTGLGGVQQQQCNAYFSNCHRFSVCRDARPSQFTY